MCDRLSCEQVLVLSLEFTWMVVFLVMTCLMYADRLSGMGAEPTYSLGDGPDPIEMTFGAANQWHLFYLITAIITAVYMIAMLIYHFSTVSKTVDDVNWHSHTRHYITVLCSSLVFRIIVCAMLSALMEQVNINAEDTFAMNYDTVNAMFGAPQNGTDALQEQLMQTVGSAYIPESVVNSITATATQAAKEVAITGVAELTAIPTARAAYYAVQDMAFVLLLVLIPRFVTIFDRIMFDHDDKLHTVVEKVAENVAKQVIVEQNDQTDQGSGVN